MSIRQKRFDTTRYGFQEGDRVKTKEEYEGKPFRGTVISFFRGLAFIQKEDGAIQAFIHPYWLVKDRKKGEKRWIVLSMTFIAGWSLFLLSLPLSGRIGWIIAWVGAFSEWRVNKIIVRQLKAKMVPFPGS